MEIVKNSIIYSNIKIFKFIFIKSYLNRNLEGLSSSSIKFPCSIYNLPHLEYM